MSRSYRRPFLAALFGAALAFGSAAARADAPDDAPPPVSPSNLPLAADHTSCRPGEAEERNRQRDAGLAALGQRLSELPQPKEGEGTLNRSGQNYSDQSTR